jgi:hypothetical protein
MSKVKFLGTCQPLTANVFALYFSLGFETLSTETLLTKINDFLHLQSKNKLIVKPLLQMPKPNAQIE